MAHLRHTSWRTRQELWRAPKGGAAKLKAYVATSQRASAGEAHGAGGSIETPHGLWPMRYGCLAAEASEGALAPYRAPTTSSSSSVTRLGSKPCRFFVGRAVSALV